jgi:hypothetical protein
MLDRLGWVRDENGKAQPPPVEPTVHSWRDPGPEKAFRESLQRARARLAEKRQKPQ